MKTKSKALLMMLCAVLLVAASVLGTMAYLTAQDTVVNTFTVGNVTLGGGANDAGLDEAKVDVYGDPIEGEARVQENTYKLVPGHTYTKDPTIHVAKGSEDCFLFVEVKNGIEDIEDIEGSETVAAQMEEMGWDLVEGETNVYVYVGEGDAPAVVKAETSVPVFESFTIKGEVEKDVLGTYEGKTITVTAYAVQADGFADGLEEETVTVPEIWAAAETAKA